MAPCAMNLVKDEVDTKDSDLSNTNEDNNEDKKERNNDDGKDKNEEELSGNKRMSNVLKAPINFTWVAEDELAGMGWPKSRDQLQFLVDEGIDHLVTLSQDKLPPHYAFPELRWSLIPVEDFSGPNIAQIVAFLNIVDEARSLKHAVGVHCAEGRGRTGVMCACFLIYYHDVRAWDAIRVMRRQRPGSVERKVQERTVVTFEHLLKTFGKGALEQLAEKEKLWREMEKRRLALASPAGDAFFGNVYGNIYGNIAWNVHNKGNNSGQNSGRGSPITNNEVSNKSNEGSNNNMAPVVRRRANRNRKERSRRCISMPKFSPEEETQKELDFRVHVANFYSNNGCNRALPVRSASSASSKSRTLLTQLKPVNRRVSTDRIDTDKSDLSRHFKDFMAAAPGLKRVRSLSQPKDNNNGCKGSKKDDDNKAGNKDTEEKLDASKESTNLTEIETRSEEKTNLVINQRLNTSPQRSAQQSLQKSLQRSEPISEPTMDNATEKETTQICLPKIIPIEKEGLKERSAKVALVRSISNTAATSPSPSSPLMSSPTTSSSSMSSPLNSLSSCRFSRLRLGSMPKQLPPPGLYSPFAATARHGNELRMRGANMARLWGARVVLTGRETLL